jgi:hypothetical protein
MGLGKHRIALTAGQKIPSVVGITTAKISTHGIYHAPGNLAACRAIEINRGQTIDLSLKGRKILSTGIRIEAAGHHQVR